MDTWDLRGTLAAIAVAGVIAAAGGAAVYAATGDGFAASGGHGPPGIGGPGFGPSPAVRDASTSVHGESVVGDGNGGYTAELTQTGQITSLDAEAVTARSADGFMQRYVIPASATAPPFRVGDEVTIRATRVGTDPTLVSIR